MTNDNFPNSVKETLIYNPRKPFFSTSFTNCYKTEKEKMLKVARQ